MDVNQRYDDNTRLSAYKTCPRSYFLRHVMSWRSEGTVVPLVFGLAWHSAMDIVWQHANRLPKNELVQGAMAAFLETWTEEGFPSDLDMEQIQAFNPRTPAIAEEMLHAYIDERWPVLSECTLIMAEQPFAVPMPGATKSWYVGRLDKVIEHNGQKLVIEHKTTAIYKKDGGFQSSYIEGWYSDSQVKGYQFGAGLYYPGLSQVWVDCALVHKTVHNAFRFVPVAHSFPLIKEWLGDTQSWVNRVSQDEHNFRAAGDHLTSGVFPKNENSCYGKFGSCAFLDICRTTPDPSALAEVPSGYLVEKWSPFETLGLDKILNNKETDRENAEEKAQNAQRS